MAKPSGLLNALMVMANLAALGCGVVRGPTDAPSLSLHASGNVTCDGQADPVSCSVTYLPGDPEAGAFELAISADAIPDGGYVGIYLDVALGGLYYEPRAQCPDSVVWPSMPPVLYFICSIDEQPERLLIHAQSDDVVPASNISHFTGTLVELDLRCPEPGEYVVALLPPGTNYTDTDFEEAPAKTIGTRQIDLDGDTRAEEAEVVDALTIVC